MRKQRSLNKCVDRYTLVEKQNHKYVTKGKVFNQTIVISTPDLSYEEVKEINEEIFKSAKFFEEINEEEPGNFVSWLTYYLKNIGKAINVTLSGQPVLA